MIHLIPIPDEHGVPLQRVRLGEHPDRAAAEAAFGRWLVLLQSTEA